MLTGEYRHTLDDKGRVFIPARLRASLGEQFVLTKGLDGCLFVYPFEEWNTIVGNLKSLDQSSRKGRLAVRHFASGAAECSVDRQGRISIPQTLREYGSIDRDVLIMGLLNRVEIWDPERWLQYQAEANREDLGEQLEGLPF